MTEIVPASTAHIVRRVAELIDIMDTHMGPQSLTGPEFAGVCGLTRPIVAPLVGREP